MVELDDYPTPADYLFDRARAAKYLGVSRRFLETHTDDGPITTRLGSRVYYCKGDLDQWVAQQREVGKCQRAAARAKVNGRKHLETANESPKVYESSPSPTVEGESTFGRWLTNALSSAPPSIMKTNPTDSSLPNKNSQYSSHEGECRRNPRRVYRTPTEKL